ncbi:MAG TPA: Cof-type HAD-IIB family hydrolase [Vicinamibacterales bacterium]|nr:Cof-type HAD-IIB family hydrolase [Vicinamibacterales bacterium]
MPANPHDIRLLISDVDGTIVTPDKTLTPRTREAVQRLADAGIAFTLTSSRPAGGLRSLVEALDITAPLAPFNGGLLVRPDLTVITEHRLDRSAIDIVIATLEAGGLDVWVYTSEDWFVRDPHGPHVDRESGTVGFRPTVVKAFGDALPRAVKVVGVSDDAIAVARGSAEVRRRCGGSVSATSSQPYYVDVTDPLANKGEVVMALADAFDVPAERVATIGDGANDVLMFAKSGVSIAMANAAPEVQRAAKFLAPSNADEGFATAIERFILGTDVA